MNHLVARLMGILAARGKSADFFSGVILQDDGAGPYIREWDEAALGARPSQEELVAVDTTVLTERRRIDAEIAALEAAKPGYVRGVREKMLGDEARIDAVRAVCENLPADDPAKGFAMLILAVLPSFSNTPGMRNVKALDDAIKLKRAQRP